jgi:hypothetical protein
MNTSVIAGRWTKLPLVISSVLVAALLAACGGGGSSGSTSTSSVTPTPVAQTDPIPTNVFNTYWNMCASPRTGVDAFGKPYPDKQGTLLDELKFLRGWINDDYLWYNEVPNTYLMANFSNPIDYFNVLKTTALTATGQKKDKYHFTYPTAQWDALSTAGVDVGYGITWTHDSTTAPRTWQAAVVEPGSPAALAGIRRGDMLTTVDGVDFINSNDTSSIDTINAGLFPNSAGEQHSFGLQRSQSAFNVSMTAASVSSDSVKNVKVIDTPTGKVGYLTFESHNAVAEKQLIDAFTQLKSAGVSDLVLDMRYNGGGLLYVASELAYMVAGPTPTTGKIFERPLYNDKTALDPGIPFLSTAYGFDAPNPAPAGQALPYLGLTHVTVLATSDTCSASEAVINGLRGVDVKVDIIGGTTCGKPYGFTPVPNCGTTYFAIEFQGVNQKGFGDYPDGMAPTCNAPDDLTHDVGDTAEGMLSAALSFRANNGVCPAPTQTAARKLAGTRAMPMTLVRPEVKEIAIITRPR